MTNGRPTVLSAAERFTLSRKTAFSVVGACTRTNVRAWSEARMCTYDGTNLFVRRGGAELCSHRTSAQDDLLKEA